MRRRIIKEENTIALAKAYGVNMSKADYAELGKSTSRSNFKSYFRIPDDADEDPSYKRDSNYDAKKLSVLENKLRKIIREEISKLNLNENSLVDKFSELHDSESNYRKNKAGYDALYKFFDDKGVADDDVTVSFNQLGSIDQYKAYRLIGGMHTKK